MIFTLNAETRNTVKKSDLTQLRAGGMIPAVLYGGGMEAQKLSINSNEFMKCYKQSFKDLAFYELNLDGNKYHTILKDKQMHPVRRDFLHLDFMVVDPDSTIEVDIPVAYTGEAIGIKEGGFMDVIQRAVKVICKANDVPAGLELDVREMKVGDARHIGDLPKGTWQYKDADDVTLVVIHAKATAEPEAAVTEEAPAEESEEA
ncbi:MAG: 50S ribosomal protein L25 [Candidatus Cloacimonadales bacterium]|jgi:large subunit ribosomal protein L25|nr:50S ribosomal protein L25 [Candidatus Cloacimonadota bacterium]MDY0380892.1 50S ribosomal protein L25 [Candidatus Cloacimonadaceae bacterium]HCM16275.1 50S ribosomal protein L25 [Candidatus Cloacimonas sp.]MCB5256343.1 50S ribosomal protein L25 [Candidatus Cloacimonadota bacterium]MCB5263471.1 50S ribosomal protein L25 [Candidatus Cloacimonadota bacterium]